MTGVELIVVTVEVTGQVVVVMLNRSKGQSVYFAQGPRQQSHRKFDHPAGGGKDGEAHVVIEVV